MNVHQKWSVKTLLITVVMMALLVGCASANNNSGQQSDETPAPASNENTSENAETSESEEPAPEEDATEYPIVIKHALGEAVIESKPERVVTIQWANHDVALALGVVPVGFSAANYGVQDDSGLLPWTAAKLDELGVENPNIFQDTDGLDFEAISDANPDVILAAYSGITQEDYDILAQIAPVVAYQTSPWVTTWREQVLFNARGMGMEAEGQQLIKDTEALIKEKASQYPGLQGKKVAFANFSAKDLSKINIYTHTDPRGEFLIELGMEYPESIINEVPEGSYNLRLSSENAELLYDADILVGYGDESLYETVKADPVLGKIPAVERGSIVFIGSGTPLAASGNPNPLSIAYTIDEYLGLIGGALDKLDE